tara:strand:+ start:40486 stop:41952 length:1467 start_codon:yes stop_codon:yes gene_type:complete
MKKKLKILHIGNIANNAFLNAKMLNETGNFSCDVLCIDYTHIMSCPEWEDAIFDSSHIDHFAPDWENINLGDYQRPKWFYQGHKRIVINDILQSKTALHTANNKATSHKYETTQSSNKKATNIKNKLNKIIKIVTPRFLQDTYKYTKKFTIKPIRARIIISKHEKEFGVLNIDLKNKFTRFELSKLIKDYRTWQKLLAHYDIVHGYAYDGIYALIHNKPYVAFEHGTIRTMPFENNYLGKLCKITYQKANHVIITNSDNIVAAKKLNLKNYTYVPHPINESHNQKNDLDKHLYEKHKSKFVIYHPARHDWSSKRDLHWDKGNDIFLEGFSDFTNKTNADTKLILVEWGRHVEKSKTLIKHLNIEKYIEWIDPQPHTLMMSYIRTSHIVADQFSIGAFGSIMPKSLMAGTPCMIYLETTLLEWCFPNPPPVLNCSNSDEVSNLLCKYYENPNLLKKVSKKGVEWYNNYHSNKVVIGKLTEAYNAALKNI